VGFLVTLGEALATLVFVRFVYRLLTGGIGRRPASQPLA
jgi:hypothetical protein